MVEQKENIHRAVACCFTDSFWFPKQVQATRNCNSRIYTVSYLEVPTHDNPVKDVHCICCCVLFQAVYLFSIRIYFFVYSSFCYGVQSFKIYIVFAILCYVVFCYTVLYCTILCCIVMCWFIYIHFIIFFYKYLQIERDCQNVKCYIKYI